MRLNPLNEVLFRIRLAERYLEDADGAHRRGDNRGTVSSSQLSVENSAKAVVAFFRIPSWSHDLSPELRELLESIPLGTRPLAEELAGIAEELAPEHGRSIYGEPIRGLTPWDIYSEEDAAATLQKAKRAIECARIVLGGLRAIA